MATEETVIRAITETATTPFITALQNRALIGSMRSMLSPKPTTKDKAMTAKNAGL